MPIYENGKEIQLPPGVNEDEMLAITMIDIGVITEWNWSILQDNVRVYYEYFRIKRDWEDDSYVKNLRG